MTPLMQARVGITCLALLASPRIISAQATPRRFEVASLKPSDPAALGGSAYKNTPQRVTFRNATLSALIANVYRVDGFFVKGLPDDMAQQKYDIEAIASDSDDDHPFGQMRHRAEMQALLEERFRLRTHRETREVPVHKLVLGNGELQLRESDMTGASQTPDVRVKAGEVIFRRFPMSLLAHQLQLVEDDGLPVIDATGLTKRFDLMIEYTPQPSSPDVKLSPWGAPVDIILDALHRAGLRLVGAKAPVEFLIIDHIEKPIPN